MFSGLACMCLGCSSKPVESTSLPPHRETQTAKEILGLLPHWLGDLQSAIYKESRIASGVAEIF